MPMKVKELTQKWREGFGEECDHFCAEIYCIYSMCVPDLDGWMKNVEDLSDIRG
jgi:hypothetical protein